MLRRGMLIFIGFLLVLGNTSPVIAQNQPTEKDVIEFVREGLTYARKHGKEGLFIEAMNPEGRFLRGTLYLFAIDFNGIVLAHGGSPDLVGTNLFNMSDKGGTRLIQEFIKAAKNGDGWVEYYWPNPKTKIVQKKLGYVVKLDDTCWLGSGFYVSSVN